MSDAYNIIVTSNSKSPNRRIHIDFETINILAISGFLLLALFIGILFDYTYLKSQTLEFELAEAENENLIQKYNSTPVSYTHLTLPTICSV